MREQRTAAPSEDDDNTGRAVMSIPLDREQSRPRSVDDLERELGETAADSVAWLRGAWLLNTIDRIVWPAQAAVRAEQLCLDSVCSRPFR